MNTRRIRVKSSIVVPRDGGYEINYSKKNILFIPNSSILKTNIQDFYEQKKTHQWTNFYLDPNFFKSNVVLSKLSSLKRAGKLFVYGKKSQGIQWDYVINRVYSRPQNLCFFCDEEVFKGANKTKDHLVPTAIVRALGYSYIDDNTVPCCKECNDEKGSLHPAYFRIKVRRLVKEGNKWSRVLTVLNKILIDKKDPFT